MAEAKDIERVKLLTGETNEELIEAYLEEASDFVKAVQENAGIPIAVLEEIAYLHGWITKVQLLDAAKMYGKSPYGQYLQKVADGKIIYYG